MATKILQNIKQQQKKERNSGLEQLECVNENKLLILGWTVPLRTFYIIKNISDGVTLKCVNVLPIIITY